jgi:shikimate dehydrogenase
MSGCSTGRIRACNCIRIRNNKLEGFNTDVTGFDVSLSTHLKHSHKKALVLGTGGAAKAVCYVLIKKEFHGYRSAEPHGKYDWIYDVTPSTA